MLGEVVGELGEGAVGGLPISKTAAATMAQTMITIIYKGLRGNIFRSL